MTKRRALCILAATSLVSAIADTTRSESLEIHEDRFIPIGGIEHWVSIKGENRANPVVLFIHGGPGNPLSNLSDSLYSGWEQEFTIVHYDQRGSGKTYGRNLPVVELTQAILDDNELTLELLVEDGTELARYLIDYLEKDTLILSGTSWGSALAVNLYQNAPELFSAYVGLSQMVDFQANLAASYALVHKRATEKADTKALQILDSLGPPHWTNPRNPGRLRRIIREYELETTGPYPDLQWGERYDTAEGRNAYYAGEEFSWVKFVGMKGDGFSNQVNLLNGGLHFEVPVFLIQGEEDLLTTPDISKRYFDRITAPRKEYLLVPEAGHDPNIAMLEKQLKVLRELKDE